MAASLTASMVLFLDDKTARGAASARRNIKGIVSDAKSLAASRALGQVGARVGAGLSRIGRAGRGLFSGILERGIDFEQRMQDMSTVTDGAAVSMDRLTQRAIDLSTDGKLAAFTAKEVADAMFEMGQSGLDANEVFDQVPNVLALAAAGNMKLGRATEVATDTATAMRLEFTELRRVADVLAATASNSNTSINKLGTGFSKVGPIAAAAGVGIEDVSAILGTFANVGLKGGISGRALRAIFSGLIKPSKQARKALAEMLGRKTISADQLKDPINTIKSISENLKGMESPERLRKLFEVFGRFGAPAMEALISQFEKGALSTNMLTDLQEKNKDATQGQGRAMEMAGDRLNTLGGDIKLLRSSLDGLALTFFREVGPSLREFIQDITEFIRENPNAVIGFLKFAAAGTAVSTALGPVLSLGSGLLSMFVNLRLASVLLGGSIAGGAGLKGALMALGGPMGALIGSTIAVTGLVIALRSELDGLRATSLRLQNDIERNAPAVAKGMTDEQLKRRSDLLEQRASREESRSKRRFDSRGSIDKFGDFILGRDRDTTVETGLRAEAAALRSELERRQEGKSRVDLNIKVNGQALVEGVQSSNADVTTQVDAGLQQGA